MLPRRYLFSVSLAAIALVALGVRLFFILEFPERTYLTDLRFYEEWAAAVKAAPLGDFYQVIPRAAGVHRYPPVFLYALQFLGWAASRVSWLSLGLLIKIFSSLIDVGAGTLIGTFLRRRVGAKLALAAAAAYLLNPGIILVSAVWGQTDALYVFWLLAAFLAVAASRSRLAGALLALGVLTKVQSVVFAPLAFTAIVWRGGSHAGWRAMASAFAVTAAVLAPFILAGHAGNVLGIYTRESLATYPWVSVFALNFWWPLSTTSAGLRVLDTGTSFLGLTHFEIGLLAFLSVCGLIVFSWLRGGRGDKNLFLAASTLALAFFMIPTEIHERYLFPVFPFLALFAAYKPRLARASAALAFTFAINLLLVLPVFRDPASFLALPHKNLGEQLLANLWLVNAGVLIWLVAKLARPLFSPKQ